MTLDERIKAAGISNTEVAHRAGVSRQVLWKARRGTDVTWPVAKAIADVLDCRPGDVCATFADDRVTG